MRSGLRGAQCTGNGVRSSAVFRCCRPLGAVLGALADRNGSGMKSYPRGGPFRRRRRRQGGAEREGEGEDLVAGDRCFIRTPAHAGAPLGGAPRTHHEGAERGPGLKKNQPLENAHFVVHALAPPSAPRVQGSSIMGTASHEILWGAIESPIAIVGGIMARRSKVVTDPGPTTTTAGRDPVTDPRWRNNQNKATSTPA